MVAVIKQNVESGRYASTSELLRDAMRTWMRDEEEHTERLASVRARIARSLDDPRPTLSLNDAFSTVREQVDRKRRGV